MGEQNSDVQEIEITPEMIPEMIEVGVDVLMSDADELMSLGTESVEILAERVFRAMFVAGREKR